MVRPNQRAASRADVDRHRRALLEAAAEELSRNPEASMDDVAQAASLTRATLYRHFSNRKTLLQAIQAEAFARAAQTLDECRLDEGSALEALQRVLTALSKYGKRFRIILLLTPESNAQFIAGRERVLAPLLDVIERGQRDGDIRVDLSAEWILTAMTSLFIAAVRAPRTGKRSEDVAGLVFRTLFEGVSVEDSKPAPKN
ncbi:TetR/AcrR family transcriptional regulator [Microbacterium sp.]|uniref:TetR/AcrR family transcriptional regulator n=1 Tax=Microbacterium sp. TaxID=51671 RepID=UPI003A94BD71